jgi:hypothetical protein
VVTYDVGVAHRRNRNLASIRARTMSTESWAFLIFVVLFVIMVNR